MQQVAAELGVRQSQVYSLIRTSQLAALKIDGRGVWRIERAELEKYLSQTYATTAAFVLQHPLGLMTSNSSTESPD